MKDIDGFLAEKGLLPESVSFEEGVAGFLTEMERGLQGESSSLAMIPAWVAAEGEVPKGKPVIVLDAGGTNFRSATFHFNSDGEPVMEHFSKSAMPGTGGLSGGNLFSSRLPKRWNHP